MLERFLNLARQKENIRAVVLVGSRATAEAPVDAWSDYDLTLFVKAPQPLEQSDSWIKYCGNVLIQLREKTEWKGQTYPTRLVIFQDGNKVDFAIYGVEVLEEIISNQQLPIWMQPGYQTLLDKGGWAKQLPPIPKHPPKHEPPSEAAFLAVVNEFFWELIYLVKNLQRDELWLARYNENVLREQLLQILEWYEQSRHGWQCDTGYLGKGMQQWLSPELYHLVVKSFTGTGHTVVHQLLTLLRQAAKGLASNLGYLYPEKLENEILAYINRQMKVWSCHSLSKIYPSRRNIKVIPVQLTRSYPFSVRKRYNGASCAS